jgi:hypothetical protein
MTRLLGLPLVARWEVRGSDGRPAFGYAEVTDGADLDFAPTAGVPSDHDIVPGAVVDDPAAEVERIVGQRAVIGWIDITESLKTPRESEWERFRREWLWVADDIDVIRAELDLKFPAVLVEARCFEPGVVRRCQPRPQEMEAFVAVAWPELVRRHADGDHGEFGGHDPTPLSPGEVFSLGLQPTRLRNRRAILVGAGIIRSRYPAGPMSAEVVTRLALDGRNQTLAYLA